VAVTILASVTLLPALLGFAGERVELTRWRRLIAAGLAAVGMFGLGLKIIPLAAAGFALALVVLVAGLFAGPLKREVPMQAPKPKQETFAYRWSRVVQHRPWVVALGATVVLLVLTVPVLSLRLCFSDESKAADDTTTKKAYDLIVDGFGPGYSGPLLLAAETPTGTTPDDLEAITAAVDADRGVAFVSPAVSNDDDTAALWNLVPTTGPQEEATSQLVDRLRDDVLPPVEDGMGFQVNVTGLRPCAHICSSLPAFCVGRQPNGVLSARANLITSGDYVPTPGERGRSSKGVGHGQLDGASHRRTARHSQRGGRSRGGPWGAGRGAVHVARSRCQRPAPRAGGPRSG
jgi:RND superfamily putative drug exporter